MSSHESRLPTSSKFLPLLTSSVALPQLASLLPFSLYYNFYGARGRRCWQENFVVSDLQDMAKQLAYCAIQLDEYVYRKTSMPCHGRHNFSNSSSEGKYQKHFSFHPSCFFCVGECRQWTAGNAWPASCDVREGNCFNWGPSRVYVGRASAGTRSLRRVRADLSLSYVDSEQRSERLPLIITISKKNTHNNT